MNRWSCNPVYTKKPQQPSSATALISAAYIISAWAAHPCRSGVGTRSDHLSLDGNRPIELPYIVRPITGGAKLASRSDRRLPAESAVAGHLHRDRRVGGPFGTPCERPGFGPLSSKAHRENTHPDPVFRHAFYASPTSVQEYRILPTWLMGSGGVWATFRSHHGPTTVHIDNLPRHVISGFGQKPDGSRDIVGRAGAL